MVGVRSLCSSLASTLRNVWHGDFAVIDVFHLLELSSVHTMPRRVEFECMSLMLILFTVDGSWRLSVRHMLQVHVHTWFATGVAQVPEFSC